MKCLITLVLCLWVAAAQAQMTLACQFKEGNGFEWKNGQWQSMRFYAEKPFFLLIQKDKRIDAKSASKVLGLSQVVCFPHSEYPVTQHSACAGYAGAQIIVSLKTLEGAVSSLFGSVMGGDTYRDTISVSPFVCQQM